MSEKDCSWCENIYCTEECWKCLDGSKFELHSTVAKLLEEKDKEIERLKQIIDKTVHKCQEIIDKTELGGGLIESKKNLTKILYLQGVLSLLKY